MTAPSRILIADDDPLMANVVRFNLTRAGFEVVVASDGRQALDRLLDDGPFDLVVTDHQMPRLTGEELCREIRRSCRPAVPVVVISAKGLELDVARLRDELDVVEVVFKPFSPRELLGLVRRTLATAAVPTDAEIAVPTA